MTGSLPPGTRDADIDRAAPGYEDEPFYCSVYQRTGMHCAHFDKSQCWHCAVEEHEGQ